MGGRIGGYGYRAGRGLLIELTRFAHMLYLVGWVLLGLLRG